MKKPSSAKKNKPRSVRKKAGKKKQSNQPKEQSVLVWLDRNICGYGMLPQYRERWIDIIQAVHPKITGVEFVIDDRTDPTIFKDMKKAVTEHGNCRLVFITADVGFSRDSGYRQEKVQRLNERGIQDPLPVPGKKAFVLFKKIKRRRKLEPIDYIDIIALGLGVSNSIGRKVVERLHLKSSPARQKPEMKRRMVVLALQFWFLDQYGINLFLKKK